jgi:endoglycosylceramidase
VRATAAGGASPSMPMSHVGRWLTDASGRVVVFHGINAAMKLPPYTLQSQGFTRVTARANGYRPAHIDISL